MYISWKSLAVVASTSFSNAQLTPVPTNAIVTTTSAPSTTASGAASSQSGPCAQVSNIIQAYVACNSGSPKATGPPVPNSVALACLNDVPLEKQRSLAFIDYAARFLEFHATTSYLRDPPTGYLLPGVDIPAGLEVIRHNVESGEYKNQYVFEKDLYNLVNVLPHDFHLQLDLPLISLFEFGTPTTLVSVSSDGTKTPEIYVAADLQAVRKSNTTLGWKPSPVINIDGNLASDYLTRYSQLNAQYQDPDALYNQVFYGAALALQNSGSIWNSNGHFFGFSSDDSTYTFENGSTYSHPNIATPARNFSGVDTGAKVFERYEVPPTLTSSSGSSSSSTSAQPTSTRVPGYPSPIALHPEGYTGGYFLPNSSVAVLAISSFQSAAQRTIADLQQQTTIETFLAACRSAGKKKLVVDLQGNTGGVILNGYDSFKQIFPTTIPLGLSRYRYTPAMNYLGEVFSTAGIYNASYFTPYQTQAVLDVNLQDFPAWKDQAGPLEANKDHFSNLLRYNLSDPIQGINLQINVSGYYPRTNFPPQAFAARDIVLLYDGSCGSTCALFSELMKAQGGVRSIAVGGRPKTGPMQGVGGSKGVEVYDYAFYENLIARIPSALEAIIKLKLPTPSIPANPLYNVSALSGPPPLVTSSARINMRNNYHSASPSEVPLQFIYEAANCRLFYTASDIFSISGLWERAANVAWGTGSCVPGSSVMADDTFPKNGGAYDTVPYSPSAKSKVTVPHAPGLVINSSGERNDTATAASSNTAKVTTCSGVLITIAFVIVGSLQEVASNGA